MNSKDLKLVVKEKYDQIASGKNLQNQSSCCCSSGCCGDSGISMIGDDYQNIDGHIPDADLGLGCGIPTEFASIQQGERVLDLGSGAGNDCFVARAIVGETGRVVGIDFSDEMIAKANQNNQKLGYKNVSFVKGDIEDMPFPDNHFDVVISNCVLNLVPAKDKAFAQIFRVLKPGGRFCVSDVVIKGELPKKLREDAEMYAGCVSGAVKIEDYLRIISRQGFRNITIHKQKEISIPEEILLNYLTKEDINKLKNKEIGIFSITVSGVK